MPKKFPTISIIVTTYNRPDSLHLVLLALNKQTQLPTEVIVADDGSTAETHKLITALQNKINFPLKHVWQENNGFQAAKIRNKAALAARGNYLIFLDGDCVPFPNFIEKHQQLAEPTWFISGNRILLNKKFTQKILDQNLPIYEYSSYEWLRHYFSGHTNELFPLLRLGCQSTWRKFQRKQWRGAKSCNLALWKKDFFLINGFDESFIGWGYEDSDLVIRLIRAGIFRKSGKFAIPVIHLWHEPNDRQQEKVNLQLLREIESHTRISAKVGIDSTKL